MKRWELDDVFLLIATVFKENELNCLWKVEMDSVLDHLIVRRVSPSQLPPVQIKQEQDILDFDLDVKKQSQKNEKEQDVFDVKLNGKKKTGDESNDCESNEDLNFDLIEQLVNFSGDNVIDISQALKHAMQSDKSYAINDSNEILGPPLDSDPLIDDETLLDTVEPLNVNSPSLPQDSEAKVTEQTLCEPVLKEARNSDTIVNDETLIITHHHSSQPSYRKNRKLDKSPTKRKPYIKKNPNNEIIKCKYCDKEFRHASRASRHEQKVHIEKSSPTCKLCRKTFKSLKTAINHCEKVHGEITLMTDVESVADLEKFREDNFKIISTDVRNGLSGNDSISNCKIKKETISNCKIKKETSKAEEVKKERHCPICQVTILTGHRQQDEYRKHLLGHFNKEIVCPICDKKFFSHTIMESHMQYHIRKDPSNIDRLFKCAYCPWVDFSADKLAFHEEVKHGQEILLPRVFVCHCAKAFTSQSNLDWHTLAGHIRYHLNPETRERQVAENKAIVSCEICGKSLKASVMRHHLKTHQEKPPQKNDRFACPDCGKTYHSSFSLKDHRMKVHLKIERKCPLCDKVSLSLIGFRQHMTETHSDERHPCKDCGKTYSMKENLRSHIRRVHRGQPVRMYKCALCPKEFNRPSLRAKHEIRQHNK